MRLRTFSSTLAALVLLPAAAHAQGWGQQPAQPPPQPSGLSAGGLAPPSAMQSDPNSSDGRTEAKLQKADREDSGRGLEFVWINGEIGIEHLSLETFKANNIIDAKTVSTKQSGLTYGGGLGVRLVFITLGARFRLASFSEWQLWTLNAELGIRIPLGDLEPYFTLGGGYASMGAFNAGNIGSGGLGLGPQDVSITGYDVRGGFGIDYYISDVFTIGVNLTGEVLGLTRPGVDPSKLKATTGGNTTAAQASAEVYKADGSSMGAGGTLTGVIGLHF